MKLGNWTSNINYYKDLYKNAKPFEYVIIKDFFDDDYANEIYKNMPIPLDKNKNWHHYDNPIEQKYSINNFEDYPLIKDLYNHLNDLKFIELLKEITEINNLELDPYLHGAGIHAYPNNGKLDMHLDYNIHPISGKERRINLIVYMNKDWKEEYGGKIELYDTNKNKISEELPLFNTAIIFKTNDLSYHGLPYPIKCPDDKFRQSIAIYYVSDPHENLTKRFKAEFFPQLNQPVGEELAKLYEIRKERLITNADLTNYFPDWRKSGTYNDIRFW